MKITVVGTGYVGLVSGTCLAEVGNDVLCLDVDPSKIKTLEEGGIPIFEPGLQEMVRRNVAAGRLHFTTDVERAAHFGTIQFIAVGTPPDEDGSADMKYVTAAARNIGKYMTDYKVVVDKSTVPVGTADAVRAAIMEELQNRGVDTPFSVVSNPEFLKEGAAIEDFMKPDRIVVGCDDEQAALNMRALYAPFQRNHDRLILMDIRSAELTKYAANAMLATRISFMNEMANLADVLGADIDHVRRGIGADSRIGHSFLYAGCGYGGSCFPKDTQALVSTAKAHGQSMKLVSATEQVNAQQKLLLVDRLMQRMGPDLTGRKIAVWGLSFKPNTDDMREATSRVVIRDLLMRGARVSAYDPVAGDEALRALRIDCADHLDWLDRFELASEDMQALQGADALMVLTEWKIFHNPDFEVMKDLMRRPFILDGRNLYNPEALSEMGIAYQGVGRRNDLVQLLSFDAVPSSPPDLQDSHTSTPDMRVNA